MKPQHATHADPAALLQFMANASPDEFRKVWSEEETAAQLYETARQLDMNPAEFWAKLSIANRQRLADYLATT